MKTNRLPACLAVFSGVIIFLLSACVTSSTQMRHGGDFSNIRSEVHLEDGSSFLAYTSLEGKNGQQSIKVQMPGERTTRNIPLSKIYKLKMEEHEFVVRMIQTPGAVRREGKPAQTRAVLKRMGMESDPVQVFEYKYEVRNPKSPIPNLHTTWYVDFQEEDSPNPLIEFGTPVFRNKWSILVKNTNPSYEKGNTPKSLKSLMSEVKKLGLEEETLVENISVE